MPPKVPIEKHLPKQLGGLAPKERIMPLRSLLELENPPLCRGTLAIPEESFTLYFGKETNARRIDLSRASEEDLAALAHECDAATFGLDQEDVLDETYRKAGKLDTTAFATFFDPVRCGLVDVIRGGLLEGHDGAKPVRVELYKLNVYGEGSFFKPHKDTPRAENMFGSLVITFPTAYTGGELVLRRGDKEWTFDPASALQSAMEPSIGFIAFFSDVEHEVLPVRSGNRVTLTYNLYFGDADAAPVPPPAGVAIDPVADTEAQIRATLQEMLDDASFLPKGGSLGFGLRHQYPVQDKRKVSPLADFLKGNDAVLLNVCRELNLPSRVSMLYRNGKSLVLLDRVGTLENCGEVESVHKMLGRFGGIIIGTPYSNSKLEEKVTWVTSVSNLNKQQSLFMAYGNQAQLDYLYRDLCLIVRVGVPGDRANA